MVGRRVSGIPTSAYCLMGPTTSTLLLFLAHQGGWDELLWFVGPAVLILAWARWAGRRARFRRSEAKKATTNMPDDTDT